MSKFASASAAGGGGGLGGGGFGGAFKKNTTPQDSRRKSVRPMLVGQNKKFSAQIGSNNAGNESGERRNSSAHIHGLPGLKNHHMEVDEVVDLSEFEAEL
jgi:hypothetical protein